MKIFWLIFWAIMFTLNTWAEVNVILKPNHQLVTDTFLLIFLQVASIVCVIEFFETIGPWKDDVGDNV